MGSPPVPTQEHSRIIRARRVVAAAEAAVAAPTLRHASTKSLPKTVANITDPDSRVMPTRGGFLQGYNAQLAVTSDHVIANQSPNDMGAFVPMMTAVVDAGVVIRQQTGPPEHQIGVVLTDTGYCSNTNLAAPRPDQLITLSKNQEHATAARQLAYYGNHPQPVRPHVRRWLISSETPEDTPAY